MPIVNAFLDVVYPVRLESDGGDHKKALSVDNLVYSQVMVYSLGRIASQLSDTDLYWSRLYPSVQYTDD